MRWILCASPGLSRSSRRPQAGRVRGGQLWCGRGWMVGDFGETGGFFADEPGPIRQQQCLPDRAARAQVLAPLDGRSLP